MLTAAERRSKGELGDVHVSTMLCRVSRGLFERVKEQGWQL